MFNHSGSSEQKTDNTQIGDGPFITILREYGVEEGVLAPVVEAFADMSSHVYVIADLVTSLLAAEHCSFFTRSHVEVNGCSSSVYACTLAIISLVHRLVELCKGKGEKKEIWYPPPNEKANLLATELSSHCTYQCRSKRIYFYSRSILWGHLVKH